MNRYRIEIEIYEGEGGQRCADGAAMSYPGSLTQDGVCAWMFRGDGRRSYAVGQRFVYPDDAGKLCPWLLSSMDGMIRALLYGGTLPWRYEGTSYEKAIDSDGVTTEFVRCPDPTASGIVAKLIRTRIDD